MSNFNKIVTNLQQSLSNTENDNLSQTLSAVRTAGGGGGGGSSYGGDGTYIEIVGNNTITLTTTAAAKLNREIPTTVAELTDSGDYATKDFADSKYQTKDSMSAYLTTANAASTYQTKDAMSAYWTSAETNAAFEEELSTLVGLIDSKQSKLTFAYDNDKISAINGSALAGQGGTTYTPGQYIDITNDEISVTGVVAIDKTSAYDPILLGDANITAVSSRVNNRTTWNLSVNATPVVTDTKLTGDNCVTAHTTETSGEWAVGLVQSAYQAIDSVGGIATDVGTLKTASANWDKVSDKLDTTAFSDVSGNFLTAHQSLDNYYTKTQVDSTFASATQLNDYLTTSDAADTYQPKGNYAPETVTATVNTLTAASAGWNEVTAKLDKSIYSNASGNWEASYNVLTAYSAAGKWLTAHQSLTDYYTKNETSGAGELSTEFAKYVTSSNVTTQGTDYVMTTTGWKVLTLPGGGMTQVIHDDTLTGQGNADNSKLGLAQTAYNAITSVSSKLDTTAFSDVSGTFLTKSSADNDYAPKSITTNVNTLTAASASWNEVSAKLGTAQYATDSAKFVTSSNSTITGTKQYALTTTGWAEVSTPTIPSITAESGISADGYTIGLTNTAIGAITSVSSKVDKPTSLNDKYLVLRTDSNGAVSGWEDLKKECYSKTEATGTFVATANIDTTTLSGDGKTVSTKLGVKTDVIATKEYVNSSFLPLSGGTVSGELVVSAATGTFDNSYVKCVNNGNDGYARFGVGSYGGAVIKAVNGNNNVQVNVKYNANNNELIQVQKSNTDIGFLIPAQIHQGSYTPTSADGILHIVLES